MGKIGFGSAHHQPPVLDTLGTDHGVGEISDLSRFTFHDDDFKAGVVIKVGVRGGNDQIVVIVLQFHQFVRQQAGVVIVDQRDGTDNRRFGRFDSGTH